MITETFTLQVSDLSVQVVKKPIKNLHLGVYPPTGWVRVAAPLRLSEEEIRAAVLSRLSWIRKQQLKFLGQERTSPREYVSGESHYYLGRRYRLRIHSTTQAGRIELSHAHFIDLHCRQGASKDHKERLVQAWHRQSLQERIPELIAQYEPMLRVKVAEWGIKRMKTRWGTCNIRAKRIWLNLDLAQYPEPCLEYVVVHEMTHLLERLHNDRFKGILDRVMPHWRQVKNKLKEGLPLVLPESEDENE
ncbi:MAG: M48 family metallopeptidase [Acidithiobacillus ferrivorans]